MLSMAACAAGGANTVESSSPSTIATSLTTTTELTVVTTTIPPPAAATEAPVITTSIPPTVANVVIRNISFTPAASISIKVGDTVAWHWQDGATPHNVTFTGFASPTMSSGDYARTFDVAGTFAFRCTLHREMRGPVTVS